MWVSDRAELFLRNVEELSELVYESKSKLEEYFADCSFSLEDSDDKVLLLVLTSDSPNIAVEKLSKFDFDWWIQNSNRAEGKLIIDVVPV